MICYFVRAVTCNVNINSEEMFTKYRKTASKNQGLTFPLRYLLVAAISPVQPLQRVINPPHHYFCFPIAQSYKMEGCPTPNTNPGKIRCTSWSVLCGR